MAVYYNRLNMRRISLNNKVNTNSHEVIAYLNGGAPKHNFNLRPGLTLNNTASASAATDAGQELGGAAAGG